MFANQEITDESKFKLYTELIEEEEKQEKSEKNKK